jgi:hypothetical protein
MAKTAQLNVNSAGPAGKGPAAFRFLLFPHGPFAEKRPASHQNLRYVRPIFRISQEVAQQLAGGEILRRKMPAQQAGPYPLFLTPSP